jgi:hypothetical protein
MCIVQLQLTWARGRILEGRLVRAPTVAARHPTDVRWKLRICLCCVAVRIHAGKVARKPASQTAMSDYTVHSTDSVI